MIFTLIVSKYSSSQEARKNYCTDSIFNNVTITSTIQIEAESLSGAFEKFCKTEIFENFHNQLNCNTRTYLYYLEDGVYVRCDEWPEI